MGHRAKVGARWRMLALAASAVLTGCFGGSDDQGAGASGTVTFDFVPTIVAGANTRLDYAHTVQLPARFVVVEALDADTQDVYASTVTDAHGNYSVSLPYNVSVVIRAKARMAKASGNPLAASVEDNTSGNAHVALALGLAACQKGFPVAFTTAASLVNQLLEARDERRLLKLQRELQSVKLLIIDELGYVPLSSTGAELLFETFSQRYERGSTIVTSNLPFEDWTSILGSERLTGALLDRLTHHVSILTMNGDSYRLRQSARRRRASGAEQNQAIAEIIDRDTGEITTP